MKNIKVYEIQNYVNDILLLLVILSMKNTNQDHKLGWLTYLYACWMMQMRHH